MFKVLKKLWIPLVILVVFGVASFLVVRVRGYFGHDFNSGTTYAANDDVKPFNPKVVTYEIFGVPGATADINYLDLDAKPQRVDAAAIPWSLTLETTAPSAAPNILAQSDGTSITCRILVDGEVKDERTATGMNALTYCFVKSA